jgi:hypothetical protein
MRRQNLWRAALEFGFQVIPFIQQLRIRFLQTDIHSARPNFGAIEFITAPGCLGMHRLEEGGDGGDGFWVRLKSDELRVMAVTFGFAAKNFLREQGLAPKSDQSFRIEIFRVQGPQTHRQNLTISAGTREPQGAMYSEG